MSKTTGLIGLGTSGILILGIILQKPDYIQVAGVIALLTVAAVIHDLILELRRHR